jgi:hypothetical protein
MSQEIIDINTLEVLETAPAYITKEDRQMSNTTTVMVEDIDKKAESDKLKLPLVRKPNTRL